MATKPVLVLMAGLAGSGKTTLATALGRELHWPILDKDLLKAELLDMELGMPEKQIGWIAYELLLIQAQDILVRQRLSLIFDTAAHLSFILERVTSIILSAEADLKIILCTANSQLRSERLNERIASNQYPSFMNSTDTVAIKNDLESFSHLPLDKLIIDTSNSLEICVNRAILFLR